jgi:serpin B
VDAANRERARLQINGWVEDETNDKIKDLIPQGVLDAMSRMVLANAVYFNAKWEYEFVKDSTSDRPFTRLDGSTVQAKSMTRPAVQFGYFQGDGFEAVELPYKGGRMSMVVVLPGTGKFGDFEKSFDSAALAAVDAGLERQMVLLQMPKFEFVTEAALVDPLKSLGMRSAFDPGIADFTGIADRPAGDLYISDVLHKAFVRVDEEGTEAAAATAIIIGVTSAGPDPVRVNVDRPFLFLIRDRETGTVLFSGRVLDPTQ